MIDTNKVEPKFTVDWFSGNIPTLKRICFEFTDQPDIHFLEIGSFEGCSTLWFLQNVLTSPSARITCCDTWEGSIEHLDLGLQNGYLFKTFCSNIAQHKNKVRILKGKSQEILPRLSGGFDLIYVDGSHDAADVLQDAVQSFRLVKIGGYIVFDDYCYSNSQLELHPADGINAFLHVYAKRVSIVERGYQMILRRVT